MQILNPAWQASASAPLRSTSRARPRTRPSPPNKMAPKKAAAAAAAAAPMMLDGAEGTSSRWLNEDIDALPYADVLPDGWREGVDQLIQEEMRRMDKRPKDYLAEMAPAYELKFKGCPMLAKEDKRVAAGGGPMPPPDSVRYNLAPPPLNKRTDENAWEVAIKNAKSQLEHQALRLQNLELALKFSPNAWRAHNASIEAAILRCVASHHTTLNHPTPPNPPLAPPSPDHPSFHPPTLNLFITFSVFFFFHFVSLHPSQLTHHPPLPHPPLRHFTVTSGICGWCSRTSRR